MRHGYDIVRANNYLPQRVKAAGRLPQQKERKNRRSIRLKDYNYASDGAYFVTICTHNRECLFGKIVDGEMQLNELGKLVAATWHDLPNHNAGIELDEFIIMPNHIHGIIIIVVGAGSKPAHNLRAGLEPAPTKNDCVNNRAGLEPAPTYAGMTKTGVTLSEIVRQLKTFSARRINQHRKTPGQPVWQRNYYEHIIRDEKSLNNICEYIQNNPLQWELDENNPNNCAGDCTGGARTGGFQTRPNRIGQDNGREIGQEIGQVWNLPLRGDVKL